MVAATAPRGQHAAEALVRAFRWKEMLESGQFATVSELCRAEKLNVSYVSHVLRLTLPAPDLVEAILHGRQPATMQLQSLMYEFPVEWERQWRDGEQVINRDATRDTI